MSVTGDDIEQLVEAMDRGRNAWIHGRLEVEAPAFPVRQADDMTIFGPFGGIAPRGVAPVVIPERQRAGAAKFKGGTGECELVRAFFDGDLAVLVMIERNQVNFEGHDEALPWVLRTTQIFRKEDGGWVRLHRHADPLTRYRDLEETIGLLGDAQNAPVSADHSILRGHSGRRDRALDPARSGSPEAAICGRVTGRPDRSHTALLGRSVHL